MQQYVLSRQFSIHPMIDSVNKKAKSEIINNKLIGRRKTVERAPFSRFSLHEPRAGDILSRA